jgi:dTDP-glucose pyrophosphorylase
MSISSALWSKSVLYNDATIIEAINVLNISGLQIVLIVDRNQRFLGTISDGDIRRGLLKGLKLEHALTQIVNHNPIVVPITFDSSTVIQIMQSNGIRQIPIVDENNRLIGLHLWDKISLPASRPNIFIIMAGGRGARLGAQTENCPKPLLLVSGKPILEHIINRAKAEGFTHFVLAIHYLGYMIESYFGNGKKLGVKIEYLRENSPLGTAGALNLLSPIPSLPFVVTNCDVITDVNYGALLDFHEKQNAGATMAVKLHVWENPYGVVKTEGNEIIGFEEKPIIQSTINAGIYVLDPISLKFIRKSEPCDMPLLFEKIRSSSLKVCAYPIHEHWLDIGQPEDLKKARVVSSRLNSKK